MTKLDSSIEFLKGVGPARAKLLAEELNIQTFRDLLFHYPFRHVDRSQFFPIKDISADTVQVQLAGKFVEFETVGKGRGQRLTATFKDDTGEIDVLWFKGISWIRGSLKTGKKYVLFGKPSIYKGRLNFVHPDVEEAEKSRALKNAQLRGVYPSTEKLNAKGLHSKGLFQLQQNLWPQIENELEETLSPQVSGPLKLLSFTEALRNMHFPKDHETLNRAIARFKFEEFFFLQLQMAASRRARKIQQKGFVLESVGDVFNTFYKEHLPFPLTGAQQRVIKEIRQDMNTGSQMNRLLQGDVGSGKTITALLCMLIAIDNGFQTALMAPTEILATQHYHSLKELLEPINVEVELLTGSTKQRDRKVLHENLQNGTCKILVGTHALIEDKVKFENLGLVVIDEQHRFGVAQRAKLLAKNDPPSHVLVMTATPIPRSLAMTFYGDLESSIIDEMPPGRKSIKTIHRTDAQRVAVFGFMKKEIDAGRQVYVVYPLIEESESMDYKDLMDGYESIVRSFPQPQFQVSIVHGRMKPDAKEYEMQRFVKGETQIMVATTVIEVGVNVPNASLMVIESAERFGLSQLHQLRGRVGRGADQSYCILMTGKKKLSEEAKTRIQTMTETNDGFKIAEVDLELRGPGDIMGTRQSGMIEFKVADLSKDLKILDLAKRAANYVLDKDDTLSKPENRPIAVELARLRRERPDWARIG